MARFYDNFRSTTSSLPTRGSMQMDRNPVRTSINAVPNTNASSQSKEYPLFITGKTPEAVTETKNTNKITIRDAKKGEKTGLQKVTFLDNDYNKHDIFLVVPERESVGYGDIRGWGAEHSTNFPTTRPLIRDAINTPSAPLALLSPLTAAGDLLVGNTFWNNVTKNARSKYTGENKAVGLGLSGESEGNILGYIDENGVQHTAEQAEELFYNPTEYGYIGIDTIEGFERPTMEQEHTGPAYVPGDLLLGFLGLQPNRGAVGFTFKEPAKNSEYQRFLRNLRRAKQKGK